MALIDEDGYASFATFGCPKCGAEVADVIFVPDSSSVKRSGHRFSTQGEAEIMCGRCTSSYNLVVRNTWGRVVARVQRHPKVPVSCSGAFHPEEMDDDRILEISDTPANNLADALADIEEVIKTKDAGFYVRTLSRMAFIQQFAALEAYLADTLTKEVLENPETLSRALIGVKDLKEIKLTLAEIAANPNIVKVTAANVLRGLLYHNFMKVDAIWNIALGFSLFPDEELKKRMLSREPIRHDCVHRNGRDKDGNERTQVDFQFVVQMNRDVHAMLKHIEDTLHPYDDDHPF